MGVCQSKLHLQVLILGLDESGKSTILNHLCTQGSKSSASSKSTGAANKPGVYTADGRSHHQLRTNIVIPEYRPTTSFQPRKLTLNRTTFRLLDLSGSAKTRDLWKHFVTASTGAIIFVVDATSRTRVAEAKNELFKILMLPTFRPETPLLVFANKCDQPSHLSYAELVEGLGLGTLKGQEWSLRMVSGLYGDGFDGALDWLVQNSTRA